MEVANWASPPTEVIEWIGEDSNWPPTDDPIASLLAKQRSAQCSPWSARVSDRLVGFGAFSVRHDGQVADLSHLLVKRHRHAVAIAVEVVHQLAALDGRDIHHITPCQELFVRQRPSQRMVSATSLRPNSRWSGRGGRSRQVPQPASCFVTKLAVPGTDGPRIGGRWPHSMSQPRGIVASTHRGRSERWRRVENDEGLTCT